MKNLMLKTTTLSLATAMLLSMTGCSSSDNSTDAVIDNPVIDNPVIDDPATTEVEKVSTITGTAVDGYLKYSTVCLDISGDKFCQADEPFTLSNDDGSFTLNVSEEQQNSAGYKTAQLVVYGGQDSDRPGEDFVGKLQAPNDGTGSVTVTPVTTLVSAYLQKDGASDVSAEDITAAIDKVAGVLGLTKEQVVADPRESNDVDLINATMQLQYAVTAMVSASDTTDTAGASENIFAAFAAGLDEVTTTGNISDIIEKMDDSGFAEADKIDENSLLAKDVAKVAAENISTILTDESGNLDQTELLALLTKMVVTQNNLIEAIEETTFVAGTAPQISGIAFSDLGAGYDFDKEATKIYLKDYGVENVTDDMLTTNISFDTSFDDFQGLIEDNTAFNGIDFINPEDEAQKDYQDEVAGASAEEALAEIKGKVDTLLAPTATADVADAKNMFTQIRETATTFIDLDTDIENQSTTLVGAEAKLLRDNIEPAVEAIEISFRDSATAMETSVDAFGTSLQTNFGAVLGTDTTNGSLEERLTALMDQIPEDSDSWTVTAGTDTLTYSETNETITTTFNEGTITITRVADDEKITSVTKTGTIELKGTDYDLEVTALSFDGTKANLTASGTITGTNSSSMTLTKLNLSLDANSDDNGDNTILSNVAAEFDGTIVSSGRTLTGKLSIAGEDISLNGTYTGLAGEPTFVGDVTAKLDVDKLIKDADTESSWYIDPNALAMIKFSDGTQSFMTGYTKQYDWNDTTYTDTTTYTLHAQNGTEVVCTAIGQELQDANTGYYNGYDYQFSCEDDVTIETYANNGDSLVVATANGKDLLIGSAWRNNHSIYDADGAYIGTNTNLYIDIMDDNQGYANIDENGTITLDDEEIIISSIRVEEKVNEFDRAMDLEFAGTLTHGTKVIKATVGISSQIDTKIYAKAIEFTDGKSFVKADELSVTLSKADFLAETSNDGDEHYNYYNEPLFESYTVNYNDNYDNDENNDLKPSSLIINNLAVSIADANDDALVLNADLSFTGANGIETVEFNGAYTYNATKFTGVIEATGNVDNAVGSYNISGTVEANGFTPFGITSTGVLTSGETLDAYALFTRGADYELGMHVTHSLDAENTSTLNVAMADSNGVLGSFVSIDMEEGEDNEPTLNITDKDGTSLATYGEDENGNEWEIAYSNGDTNTLF